MPPTVSMYSSVASSSLEMEYPTRRNDLQHLHMDTAFQNHYSSISSSEEDEDDERPMSIHHIQERDGDRIGRKSFILICILGCVLGIFLPKNKALPTPWYQVTSSSIGYTYFLFWSCSFYPQLISNWKRKSTDGFSNDFASLNVIGYICYVAYTTGFFLNRNIQIEYQRRHQQQDSSSFLPKSSTVQSNDVAFAIHALAMSTFQLYQSWLYDGFSKKKKKQERDTSLKSSHENSDVSSISSPVFVYICIIVTWSFCYLLGVFVMNHYRHVNTFPWTWLDFLYLLSYFKVSISVAKYIPQILLNIQRQSTIGWSIWGVIFDLSGGLLSLIQLLFDSLDMGTLSGITGNLAKLGLSFVTIFFDLVFLYQHYFLYK